MVELFNRRKVEINSEKCGEMVQNVLEALEIQFKVDQLESSALVALKGKHIKLVGLNLLESLFQKHRSQIEFHFMDQTK